MPSKPRLTRSLGRKHRFRTPLMGLDTETTGLDLRHGARPFLVTTCDEDGTQRWWEWDVDPFTREVRIPPKDLLEVQDCIDGAELVVLQNTKFDYTALQLVYSGNLRWDWSRVRDTLLAGHLIQSNEPHDLASMVLKYLNVDILSLENAVKAVAMRARTAAGRLGWRIAKKGLPEMPSVRGEVWKQDMWVPRQLHLVTGEGDESWVTACAEYANGDSESTVFLFKRQEQLLRESNLWRIYEERLKLLPIIYRMEDYGVTLSRDRLETLHREFSNEAALAEKRCITLCPGLDKLPKAGTSNALKKVLFTDLRLPVISRSKKTGEPSVDADTLEHFLLTLPERSKALSFIRNFKGYRKRTTGATYAEGYRRFWLPLDKDGGWYVLHPSLNPTGSQTLRWSSSNPNEQNISKQEGFNLRYCFGPAPGREWWSIDAKNIELRLPAYEAKEVEMISLFERPKDPPYFGSYHLLVFDILHPEKFAEHGVKCKDVYESTWYKYTKCGNFAVQYGAIEESGTADQAYHVPGAQRRIKERFSKLSALNEQIIDHAERFGYVETIPDRTVDPKRGYPLFCTRSKWGKILPTVPLNYHIQGTAMWWMMKAMIRCQGYLEQVGEERGETYAMVMQVHDELVFDFPRGSGAKPWEFNLPIIQKVAALMEQGGDDIGVPTPVSVTYHSDTWDRGAGIAI